MFCIIDNSHSVDRSMLKDKKYGNYSITVSAVESWNKIQKKLKDMLLRDLSPNKIQKIVSAFYLKSY